MNETYAVDMPIFAGFIRGLKIKKFAPSILPHGIAL